MHATYQRFPHRDCVWDVLYSMPLLSHGPRTMHSVYDKNYVPRLILHRSTVKVTLRKYPPSSRRNKPDVSVVHGRRTVHSVLNTKFTSHGRFCTGVGISDCGSHGVPGPFMWRHVLYPSSETSGRTSGAMSCEICRCAVGKSRISSGNRCPRA